MAPPYAVFLIGSVILSAAVAFVTYYNVQQNIRYSHQSYEAQDTKSHKSRKVKCSICSRQFNANEKLLSLTCGHTFHSSCISKKFEESQRCPECKHLTGMRY